MSAPNEIKLFTGNANRELAVEISKILGISLGIVKHVSEFLQRENLIEKMKNPRNPYNILSGFFRK
jgi:phosphoribosylpyrophosphate synthetase